MDSSQIYANYIEHWHRLKRMRIFLPSHRTQMTLKKNVFENFARSYHKNKAIATDGARRKLHCENIISFRSDQTEFSRILYAREHLSHLFGFASRDCRTSSICTLHAGVSVHAENVCFRQFKL